MQCNCYTTSIFCLVRSEQDSSKSQKWQYYYHKWRKHQHFRGKLLNFLFYSPVTYFFLIVVFMIFHCNRIISIVLVLLLQPLLAEITGLNYKVSYWITSALFFLWRLELSTLLRRLRWSWRITCAEQKIE